MQTASDTSPILRYAPKMASFFLTMDGPKHAHIAKKSGMRWDSKVGHWGSKNINVALKLEEYADQITKERIERIKERIKLSYAPDDSIVPPHALPAAKGKDFKPYQLAGIYISMLHRITLLGDEQGLGKTIQAIGVFNEMRAAGCKRPMLVVCPASVKLNWAREISAWATESELKIQVLQGSKASIQKDADVIVVNYDLVAKLYLKLFNIQWGLAVLDEGHYVKNPKAKRTKALLGYRLDPGIIMHAQKILILTGTPITNRPIEFWPILHRLSPETIDPYDDYFTYGRYFCGGFQGGFGWDMSGSSNELELNTRLRSTIMVRRLKKDVLKDLPDKIFQLIPLETSPESRSIIRKEGTLELSDAKRKTLRGFDAGQIAELRHQMAQAKLPVCIDHIEDLLGSGIEKVVVFAHHTKILEGLIIGLQDHNPVLIDGSVSAKMRQDNVDRFQNDPSCRVFVGQLQAAGVGITLTAANTVVFVETSWVPGEIAQAVDRCHRIGQKDSVLAQFLVVQGSLEEYMLRTVLDKQLSINQILGD